MKRGAAILFLLVSMMVNSGCVTSTPGFVARDRDSKVVTIGAGRAIVSTDRKSDYWRLWYIIDPTTQTCWFKIGDSVGPVDCCRFLRIPKAPKHLAWLPRSECEAKRTAQETKPLESPASEAVFDGRSAP